MTNAQIKDFIGKCKKSASFFIESVCKVKHPLIGIIPVKLFNYQKMSLGNFRSHRFNIFRKSRQAGISTLTGLYALWVAMFFPNKTILIVSKRDGDAKNFLNEHIKLVFNNMPDWVKELWRTPLWNEHEVGFSNGSIMRSLTSSPDTLRSNASSLNIIDEAGFMPDMENMWAGGWSCGRGDTLIQTTDGLIRLDAIANKDGQQWQDINIDIMSDDGVQPANKFFVNGPADTIIINTKLGFEFEATAKHKLRVIDINGDYIWRELHDIKIDDLIVKLPGNFSGKRRRLHNSIELSPDFAEILGLYVGDGSISKKRPKRLRIYFDPQDILDRDATVSKFNSLGLNLSTRAYAQRSGHTVDFRLNSAEFIDLLNKNNLISKTNAYDAIIPSLILQSDKETLCAFIRGLFSADGWCYNNSTHMQLGFSTQSEKLSEQVQIVLHGLGIISKRCRGIITKNRFGKVPAWRVEVLDNASKVLYRQLIGFCVKRKQAALDTYITDRSVLSIKHPALVQEFCNLILQVMPNTDGRKFNIYAIRQKGRVRLDLVKSMSVEFNIDCRLNSYIKSGLIFDTITLIRSGHTITYDISVPSNNTYIANGFISHNTLQHGGCLEPESLVLDATGLRPISSYHYGHSKWVNANAAVATDDNHSKVIAAYANGVVPTRHITTVDGHYVGASLQHKFRILENGKYTWKTCSDLNPGDRAILSARAVESGSTTKLSHDIFNCYPNGCHLCGRNYSSTELRKVASIDDGFCPSCLTTKRMISTAMLPETITPELAKFIGCWLGDGFYDKQGRFGISCDRRYTDYITWLHTIINKLGGVPRNEISIRNGKIHDFSVRFNHKALALMFERNGIHKDSACQAIIPQVILTSGDACKCSFLSGLFETDGCVSGNCVSLSSASLELVRQTQTLLLSLGIRSRVSSSAGSINRYSNKPIHALRLKTNYDISIFRQRIGFISSIKSDKLICIKLTNRSHNDRYTDVKAIQDFYAASIGLPSYERQHIAASLAKGAISRPYIKKLATEFSQLRQTTLGYMAINDLFESTIKIISDSQAATFDISVDDDKHTYLANGFVSHNSVIVISTPNGIGNWYWDKWTDAEDGNGLFNPILINWWGMDWVIEANDSISNKNIRIAPTDGIRKCTTKEEIEKWGPYWSPWLEDQFKALRARGEGHLFRQEILAEFLGGGGTIISSAALLKVGRTVEAAPTVQTISEPFLWINQASGEREYIDFASTEVGEGLYIWAPPVAGRPPQYNNGKIIDPGEQKHVYVMGVDVATGENNDYSAIEVFDLNTMEQVAEYMGHIKATPFSRMVDWLGRWYNDALANIERTGIGVPFIQDMYELIYPNLWKPLRQSTNGTIVHGQPGFATTDVGKNELNKALIHYVSDIEDQGFTIRSFRLYKQLQIYIRKRNRKGIETRKTGAQEGRGNHDDLVIATGLCAIASPDAADQDPTGMAPVRHKDDTQLTAISDYGRAEIINKIAASNSDTRVIIPLTFGGSEQSGPSSDEQLAKFTNQLIAPQKQPLAVIFKPDRYKTRPR